MKRFSAIFLSLFLLVFSVGSLADGPYPSSNFTWIHPTSQDARSSTSDIQNIFGLKLEDYQVVNLLLAKRFAEALYPKPKRGDSEADRRSYVLMVMGIMWQESKAGKFGPVGDTDKPFGERSYGMMQVKRRTADKMLKLSPAVAERFFATRNPPDEETIAALIYNPEFNITMACLYLNYLHATFHLSWVNTITAYNRGYGGAAKTHFHRYGYTRDVLKHRRAMQHVGAHGTP